MDKVQNKWWIDVIIVMLLVLSLLGIKTYQNVILKVETPKPLTQYATVQINGAVVIPGVYEVPLPATVWDVVVLAGGTTEGYDDALNHLAKPIAHGDKVIVYGTGDDVIKEVSVKIIEEIDINTATLEDWISVDGIGSVLAQRIISYRFENGPFRSVDELAHVSGIGEKKLSEIKKQVICQLNDPK